MINKKQILRDFDFPCFTEEIREKIYSIESNNVHVVTAVTKIINHSKVDIFTLYCKETGYNKTINEKIYRIFISKDDYLIQYRSVDGELYTGKRDFISYSYSFPVSLINDEKTQKILDRYDDKYNKYERDLEPYRLCLYAIYNIQKNKRDRKRKKRFEENIRRTKEEMKSFKKIEPSVSFAVKKESREKFPVYFFEKDDTLYCTACRRERKLEKLDKHLTTRTCPFCKKEGTVERVSRCKARFDDHHYMIETNVVDNKVLINYYLCKRYIYSNDYKNPKIEYSNCNRMIIDFKEHKITRYYSYGNKFVSYEGSICHTNFDKYCGLFRNYYNMYYCGYGFLTKDSFTVIKKAEGFSYYNRYFLDKKERINMEKEDFYNDVIITLFYEHTGAICEKLVKAGFKYLLKAFAKPFYSRPSVSLNTNETSLYKILKISKAMLRFSRDNHLEWDDIKHLQDIHSKKIPFIEDRALLILKSAGLYHYKDLWDKVRLINYISKQYAIGNKFTVAEYQHYLENMDKLGMPHDKGYLYPDNFYEFDHLISRQLDEKSNLDQVRAIKVISEGLRNMDGINEFMAGSKGLLVKVPETPADFREEGMMLHNCIGSYIESIADGKTFIFFIRKIEEPDKPFFAMEYKDGRIVQIHGYGNCNPNKKIEKFCNSFSKYLKESKFEPKKLLEAA